MTRSRSFLAMLTSLAAVAAVLPVDAAWGVPSISNRLTYEFRNCTGPAGTPEQFDAVKQPGGAAGLRITDRGGIFVVMEASEGGVVLFTTPGLLHNGLPTVTCWVVNPTNDRLQEATGLIVPAPR